MAMIPRNRIPALKNKMAAATDPAQQAKIQNRIDFLKPQTGPGYRQGVQNMTAKMANTTDPEQLARQQARARFLQGKAGMDQTLFRKQAQPQTGGGVQVAEGSQAPNATTGVPPVDNSQLNSQQAASNATDILFPSMRAFEPANYEGSPMFKWRMEQGNKELNKRLAAQGQMGSGTELESAAQLYNQLTGEESTLARQQAEQEANRYAQMQENEANRLANREDAYWGRNMDILNFYNQQNPMQYGFQGATRQGDLGLRRRQRRSQFQQNNYPRYSSYVGRPGTQPIPGFQAPMPTGPNYDNINTIDAAMQGPNNMSYWDAIKNGVAGLF